MDIPRYRFLHCKNAKTNSYSYRLLKKHLPVTIYKVKKQKFGAIQRITVIVLKQNSPRISYVHVKKLLRWWYQKPKHLFLMRLFGNISENVHQFSTLFTSFCRISWVKIGSSISKKVDGETKKCFSLQPNLASMASNSEHSYWSQRRKVFLFNNTFRHILDPINYGTSQWCFKLMY